MEHLQIAQVVIFLPLTDKIISQIQIVVHVK